MAERTITGHAEYRVEGTVCVPGDKSIAHRVLIAGAMARGTTYARSVPDSMDIEATIRCLKGLRVPCERFADAVSVVGLGRKRFAAPAAPLDCGGSATTMRLLLGALTAKGVKATLAGDPSLTARPMDRVIEPLSLMGATFDARNSNRYPPVTIVCPDAPVPIDYELPVASAQVKSAIILAATGVRKGRTVIRGALGSRDHTERLLPRMGGSLVVTGDTIVVEGSELEAISTTIPGDPSAAAFFAAAAAILRNSRLTLRGVSTNPTRIGFFEALSWMGADVQVQESPTDSREPAGDFTVRWTPLKGITVGPEAVPFLIDEVPLLMLLGVFAEGETELRGISELRVKETDRISCAVDGLRRMGASIDVADDSVRIRGGGRLRGALLDPRGDHRMSMMFTIAALAASGDSTISGVECEYKSYPGFHATLAQVVS